jgi:hypothetical protein
MAVANVTDANGKERAPWRDIGPDGSRPAKYAGTCPACGKTYEVGELIRPAEKRDDRGWRAFHPDCADRQLPELAVRVRHDIEAADKHWQNAVGHAIRAGEGLLEAKDRIPHGSWTLWLEQNFDGFSPRSAQLYMQLARNRNLVADLPTIREAVAALPKPKRKRAGSPKREKAPPEQPQAPVLELDPALRKKIDRVAAEGPDELREEHRKVALGRARIMARVGCETASISHVLSREVGVWLAGAEEELEQLRRERGR